MGAGAERAPTGGQPAQAERQLDAALAGLQRAAADLHACLARALDPLTRARLQTRLWAAERALGAHPLYHSQCGQDRYLHEAVFGERRDGVFLDIGGYDGVTGSNTYFFEKTLGWRGVIVEAVPDAVPRIRATRSAAVVHGAVGRRDGEAELLVVQRGYTQMSGLLETYPPALLAEVRAHPQHDESVVLVPMLALDTLVRRYGGGHIDYCSIDVEGAERAILEHADLARLPLSVLSVERRAGAEPFLDLLGPHGFEWRRRLGEDDIYVHPERLDAARDGQRAGAGAA